MFPLWICAQMKQNTGGKRLNSRQCWSGAHIMHYWKQRGRHKDRDVS